MLLQFTHYHQSGFKFYQEIKRRLLKLNVHATLRVYLTLNFRRFHELPNMLIDYAGNNKLFNKMKAI